MTITCADILTRTLALSVANQGLLDASVLADVQDTLTRINQAQVRAFTEFTEQNRVGFLTTTTLSSTAGNGNRTLSLATQNPPVLRIVLVTLATSDVEIALVDPAVPTSEMAPRYYTRGQTLVEVSNDWDTASTNAVALVITYAQGAAPLDTSAVGSLTQAVSIPDGYTDLLVYELGAYLAEKDVGREDAEVAALNAKRDAVLADWIASAAQFGGTQVYAFNIPAPTPTSKS